jgi:hypothetical protein
MSRAERLILAAGAASAGLTIATVVALAVLLWAGQVEAAQYRIAVECPHGVAKRPPCAGSLPQCMREADAVWRRLPAATARVCDVNLKEIGQ